MAASALQVAKRALVKLLLTLAVFYSLRLEVSRDSADQVVVKNLRKLLLKAHPDKGGSVAHTQQLTVAREAWEKAKRQSGKAELDVEGLCKAFPQRVQTLLDKQGGRLKE